MFIHLFFQKYLSRFCFVAGTIWSTEDRAVNRIDKASPFMDHAFWCMDGANKYTTSKQIVYQSPMASVTNYHMLDGLTQQKCILSQF